MNDTIRTTEEVDVLIIGSGPAGATYARTIGDARPSARILMVEVGPAVPGRRGEHTQNMTESARTAAQLLTQGPDAGVARATALADIAPGIDPSLEFRTALLPGLFPLDPNPRLADGEVGLPGASMASGVGGMGIHWGTSTPRPHQSERIPFVPGDELDAALDHAERLLGVNRYEPAGLSAAVQKTMAEEFNGPGLTPVTSGASASHWEGDTLVFSGTGVILGELEETVPGFELRAETLARRVLVADGTAVGAVLENRRTGETYEVGAARVVVCADGLRTPQVLFASGIRPRALGHYLNEHFQMNTFVTLHDEFDPATFDQDGGSLGGASIPFSDARPMQGGIVTLANSPYKLPFGDELSLSRLGIAVWYGAKDIQYRDAVEFSETQTDGYGMPRMTIRYAHTDKDRATIEAMRENSIRSASRIGTVLDQPEFAVGGSSLHYQGTVRMGESDDGESVCDQYLRVWDVDNLYVGGNGVIPTATAANPTLTMVALAWRAAVQLVQELGELEVTTRATAR